MIKPSQIRGARAMLGMTQATLAKVAGISTTGLNNIERGDADPKASTLDAIRLALEGAGVVFDLAAGEGPGVRFKAPVGATPPAPNHPRPVGPATDAVERMEAEIERDRGKRKAPTSRP